jgi:uncharacterized protein YjiS (DUF1127 family)
MKSETMTHNTYHTPSHDEVQTMLADARRMQAEATRDLARGFARAVMRGVRGLAGGIARMAEVVEAGSRARSLSDELLRMSDAQLAARGLTRADIPARIAAVFADEDKTPAPAAAETGATPVPASPAKRPARHAADTEIREAA